MTKIELSFHVWRTRLSKTAIHVYCKYTRFQCPRCTWQMQSHASRSPHRSSTPYILLSPLRDTWKQRFLLSCSRNGCLIRIVSVEGAIEKLVPTSLQHFMLYQSPYPRKTAYPTKRCMYDTLRCEFCWFHMGKQAYTTVNDCCTCAHHWTWLPYTQHLKLFPASGLLQIFAMCLPVPLSKNKSVTNSSSSWRTVTRSYHEQSWW